VRAGLESVVCSAGFWAAVVLPFVVLVLLATGVAARSPMLVGGLLLLNVTGLLVGQYHDP
jgi:hypothetical protein